MKRLGRPRRSRQAGEPLADGLSVRFQPLDVVPHRLQHLLSRLCSSTSVWIFFKKALHLPELQLRVEGLGYGDDPAKVSVIDCKSVSPSSSVRSVVQFSLLLPVDHCLLLGY